MERIAMMETNGNMESPKKHPDSDCLPVLADFGR